LSALCESIGVELLKNGETFKMAIPCQALDIQSKEGVETLRAAAAARNSYAEEKVQPTNAYWRQ
tara:strand:+ start:1772 stop:1963 length:192 start_codon:yes stop_codon:yes gene_type:complete